MIGIRKGIFVNEKHEENFKECFEIRFGEINDNKEYAATFYILSLPLFFSKTKNKILDGGIDFPSLLDDDTFSSGEKYLINVAYALFKSNTIEIDLSNLCVLSEDNYLVFKNALDIRRYGFRIKFFENHI